jgi:hypothetical protein
LDLLVAPDLGVLPSLLRDNDGGNDEDMELSPLETYRRHMSMKNGELPMKESVFNKIIPFQENAETVGCFALGRNKVFIKHPVALFSLERLRLDKLPHIARIIEGAWRRYVVTHNPIFCSIFLLATIYILCDTFLRNLF